MEYYWLGFYLDDDHWIPHERASWYHPRRLVPALMHPAPHVLVHPLEHRFPVPPPRGAVPPRAAAPPPHWVFEPPNPMLGPLPPQPRMIHPAPPRVIRPMFPVPMHPPVPPLLPQEQQQVAPAAVNAAQADNHAPIDDPAPEDAIIGGYEGDANVEGGADDEVDMEEENPEEDNDEENESTVTEEDYIPDDPWLEVVNDSADDEPEEDPDEP